MNVFVFDIETVPDTDAGRRIYELDDLSGEDVAKIMFQKRREQTGDSDFLRHHLHKIIAISAVFKQGDSFKVWTLGEIDSDEKEIVQHFFDGVDKYTPTLVSWNGSGFDLPVLHYRAMKHGVNAARYWDMGEGDRDFKWNNYISRYHWRHIDVMDVIAGFQPRASAPLDQIAVMLGLPGKMGMSGANVWDQYVSGNLVDIRNYCETDVLNTYLVYLHWEVTRGNISAAALKKEFEIVKKNLAESGKPHLQEFLDAWNKGTAK